ncbi:MAG: hypothetical protein H7Y07_16085 [Pyrinomonadaceae bacterium]|nr:hypothetical protein [Sphingobacteriaceae bacterium]
MKSIQLKISFVLLVLCFMGAGCEKEVEANFQEINFLKVKGLSLQDDTCFIAGGSKDLNLVINSQEDFEKYFECKNDYSPQIDFSQYTLLTGSRAVNCIYPTLALQQILVDDKNKAVQFKAQFEYDSGCYAALGVIYYHALIPKLKNSYTVSFDITINSNKN